MEIGDKLYGVCDGFFGREYDGEKTIEAIGEDWIVAREETGEVLLAVFSDEDEKDYYIDKWSNDEEEDTYDEDDYDYDYDNDDEY